jgi:O-acetyl-ADP-ribose deacetylase
MNRVQIHRTIIELVQGDITDMTTDAIVNAANSQLSHGGGVAGAIVKKGGQVIQDESSIWVKAWGGEVSVGSAAITSGGKLKAKYVIHAVGPRMGEGDEDAKLKKATLSSLQMADRHNLKSVALPAISTGIFGYPMDRCARVMIGAIFDYLSAQSKLERVVFCLWDQKAYGVFEETFSEQSRSFDPVIFLNDA